MTATEMLKSFHMMFPPKNTEQELKFTSMKESLDAYFQQKILPLRERIQKENFSWNLTNHLEKMFNIAFKKFKYVVNETKYLKLQSLFLIYK